MSNVPTPADEVTPPTSMVTPSKTTHSTPVKHNLQGSLHFSSGTPMNASEVQARMASELRDQWVGPMPINQFISTFFKLPPDILKTKPAFTANYFATMAKCEAEKDMYANFITLVGSANAMPGFKLVNTSVNFDPTLKQVPGMKNKPDVSCYSERVDTSTTPTKYDDMELIFEFKPASSQADPFDDPPESSKRPLPQGFRFENKGKQHTLCRGQIACYARTWMAKQHRTHCFMVWIGGPYARLIRIDRSGGVVSERFHYETNVALLDFLWKFSMSTDEARGIDPTVTPASAEESKLAIEALNKWEPPIHKGVLKLKIPDPSDEDRTRMRDVLVWGPLADPQSVTGRATRGYPAYDPSDKRTFFVKDSWRSCEEGMEKESDILRVLNDKKVRNVPKLLCGDDLSGQHQTTTTQKYAEEKWNLAAPKAHFVKRVHTRFAEDFIGLPLYKFRSAKQLFQAIYDAFLAHQDAYEKCNILHRDISAGNVLLDSNGGGILNDWDLARYVDKDRKQSPFRSGTWQFMSIGLLINPSKMHLVQDDMESFYWLLLYHALRYLKHDKVDELKGILKAVFDQYHEAKKASGLETGGDGKRTYLGDNAHIGTFSLPDNRPMTIFLWTMKELWNEWYLYVNRRRAQIERLELSEEISIDEASKRIPFEPPQETASHAHMASLFETVLARLDWPPEKAAIDFLPKTAKRGRDKEEEDDVHIKSGSKANKRPTVGIRDNSAYKSSTGRSAGTSNLSLPALTLPDSAPVTRSQSKAAGLSGDDLNEPFS